MQTTPLGSSLDGFIEMNEKLEGVALRELFPFDTICVRTYNSDYRVLLLEPETGRALVQGGRFFAEPAEAVVDGSTFGGCMIKPGWIGLGLRLEIRVNGQAIITSPVQAIRVERETGLQAARSPEEQGNLKGV
jgi:hypothetical protein